MMFQLEKVHWFLLVFAFDDLYCKCVTLDLLIKMAFGGRDLCDLG